MQFFLLLVKSVKAACLGKTCTQSQCSSRLQQKFKLSREAAVLAELFLICKVTSVAVNAKHSHRTALSKSKLTHK